MNGKYFFSWLPVVLLMLTPASARAEEAYPHASRQRPAREEKRVGDFIIVTDGMEGAAYTYGKTDETGDAPSVLTILTDAGLTIRNADPGSPTQERIVVGEMNRPCNANITLAGVNIDMRDIPDDEGLPAFQIISESGTVTLKLAEGTENNLISGKGRPGLEMRGAGVLLIDGRGTLNVTGGDNTEMYEKGGAGVSGETILITGGIVNAAGGNGGVEGGAGIGGSNSTVVISGGKVTALGGGNSPWVMGGAGIGGKNVAIEGGIVEAAGGYYGAGIGGNGSTILIRDGTVTAAGGTGSGVGIGNSQSTVRIGGGIVTATGGSGSAEGGAGIGGNEGAVEISGGTVIARGGKPAGGDTPGDGSVEPPAISGRALLGSVTVKRGGAVTLFDGEHLIAYREEPLTIEAGGTFINEGTLILTETDALKCDGILDGSGEVITLTELTNGGADALAFLLRRETGEPERMAPEGSAPEEDSLPEGEPADGGFVLGPWMFVAFGVAGILLGLGVFRVIKHKRGSDGRK